MKSLRTARLGSNFTSSYKKECIAFSVIELEPKLVVSHLTK